MVEVTKVTFSYKLTKSMQFLLCDVYGSLLFALYFRRFRTDRANLIQNVMTYSTDQDPCNAKQEPEMCQYTVCFFRNDSKFNFFM